MSSSLGSLAIAAGVPVTFGAPNDGLRGIVIGNESGLTVTITMESGGVQKTLYPSTVDWFDVRRGFTGNIKIAPVAILNNAISWPSSSLIFDAIGINDPEHASQYPFGLGRTTNIGNNAPLGINAQSISNDGNPAGASLIEATVLGDATSAITLSNDAVFALGNAAHPGSFAAAGIASFLAAIKPNIPPTVVAGNTAGDVTIWPYLQGNVKALVLRFFSFRNAGADQSYSLPTAFAVGGFAWVGNFVDPVNAAGAGLQVKRAGNLQNWNLYRGSNAAPATTFTCTAMNIAEITAGFDTLVILGSASWTGTATGNVFIIGS